MEIIISNQPETLEVPAEYVANVKAAAMMVGKLYGVENGEVSITLTNNKYIHELNKQYRGIDRPTDVLSFALNESEEPEIAGGMDVNILGDLIIHGMLHLLGYDHMEAEERAEMEAEQRFVMEKLGIPRE